MNIYTVTVFENGDMTTSVWGVYDTEEKALKRKEELVNNVDLNSNGYYLEVSVDKHEVR